MQHACPVTSDLVFFLNKIFFILNIKTMYYRRSCQAQLGYQICDLSYGL